MPALVILGYLVLVTIVGVALSRRNRSSADWAVADGRMGIVLIAAGVAGTRIGGVGTYGVAGDVMSTGVWNLWYAVNTFLALAMVGLFFAVPFRRLRVQTVSEVFTQRFGPRRCQTLTSLCVQTEYLIINILEPFVIGSIVSAVLGIPFSVGVLIGAACLILYTSLGGLWGSAVTNVIHCAVILLGLLLVCWIGLRDAGGFGPLHRAVDAALAATPEGVTSKQWWSFVGVGWGAVIAMFFSATIHTPAASVYVNFSSAAKRERNLLPAFLLGGVIAALMPLLAGFIGMLTLARYGSGAGISSYRAITSLALDLSPLLGGIALAAILAAVISSGGPILLASSTMFVRDWLPKVEKLPQRRQLAILRATTVIYGLIAALIAWLGTIGSILDLLLLGFAMVVPPAIALGFVLYWRRTTETACFWGILIGYSGGLSWYAAIRWAEATSWLAQGPSAGSATESALHSAFVANGGIDPSYITTLIPLLIIPLMSLRKRAGGGTTDHATGGLNDPSERFYERLASPRSVV